MAGRVNLFGDVLLVQIIISMFGVVARRRNAPKRVAHSANQNPCTISFRAAPAISSQLELP